MHFKNPSANRTTILPKIRIWSTKSRELCGGKRNTCSTDFGLGQQFLYKNTNHKKSWGDICWRLLQTTVSITSLKICGQQSKERCLQEDRNWTNGHESLKIKLLASNKSHFQGIEVECEYKAVPDNCTWFSSHIGVLVDIIYVHFNSMSLKYKYNSSPSQSWYLMGQH